MDTKTSTWAIIIETLTICILSFLLFRSCNEKIIIDTHVEDSLRVVSKIKDSVFKIKNDSAASHIDSLSKKDSVLAEKYKVTTSQALAANRRAVELEAEVNRLRSSQSIDSLNKVINDLNDAYLAVLELYNDSVKDADSALSAKDVTVRALKDRMILINSQLDDVKRDRDAFAADDHSKDSIIIKLSKQKSANNIWAKIATIGFAISTAIAILKH